MGDLRDQLDQLDSSEQQAANLQIKIDKLMRVVEKQKAIINDLERLLQEKGSQPSGMTEIPDDIRDLKEMIGDQRIMISEKDSEIEHVKGDLIQAQTELSHSKKQMIPTQQKLKEYVENIGQLKTEISDRDSKILFNNDKILNLEGKINTLETSNQRLQEETKKRSADTGEQHRLELDQKEIKSSEEREELRGKIRILEKELSEVKVKNSELESEASDTSAKYADLRASQENLITKVDELTKIKRDNEDTIKSLTLRKNALRDFVDENSKKMWYYDKLSLLMERDDQFKTFLILEKVGGLPIDDLQKALGAPSVMVGRFVAALKKINLIEENNMGKLVISKPESEE